MSTSNTIVRMANDGDLMARFTAVAAQEEIPSPDNWVNQHRWQLVASDSNAVASYQYAMETDNDSIGLYGKRSDVIDDTKLLSIVQALRTAETAPPLTE